ncbi:MAG: hypothetical protein SXQ77_00945 [Halobacteria archaeon]|nr:hypothetical protein [Halobacteria archaeon]
MDEVLRNELLSIFLLSIGVILIANPFYIVPNPDASQRVQVIPQEVSENQLTVDRLRSMGSVENVRNILSYGNLSANQTEIIDDALTEGYEFTRQNQSKVAFAFSGYIRYNGSLYRPRVETSGSNGTLGLVKLSQRDSLVIARSSAFSNEEMQAFEEAKAGGGGGGGGYTPSANSSQNVSLSDYDFVNDTDEGIYYRIETSGSSVTASRTEYRAILSAIFTDLDELPADARDNIRTAIEQGSMVLQQGEPGSNLGRSAQLIEYQNSFYIIRYNNTPPAITDKYGLLNLIVGILGLLVAIGGLWYGKQVYAEYSD